MPYVIGNGPMPERRGPPVLIGLIAIAVFSLILIVLLGYGEATAPKTGLTNESGTVLSPVAVGAKIDSPVVRVLDPSPDVVERLSKPKPSTLIAKVRSKATNAPVGDVPVLVQDARGSVASLRRTGVHGVDLGVARFEVPIGSYFISVLGGDEKAAVDLLAAEEKEVAIACLPLKVSALAVTSSGRAIGGAGLVVEDPRMGPSNAFWVAESGQRGEIATVLGGRALICWAVSVLGASDRVSLILGGNQLTEDADMGTLVVRGGASTVDTVVVADHDGDVLMRYVSLVSASPWSGYWQACRIGSTAITINAESVSGADVGLIEVVWRPGVREEIVVEGARNDIMEGRGGRAAMLKISAVMKETGLPVSGGWATITRGAWSKQVVIDKSGLAQLMVPGWGSADVRVEVPGCVDARQKIASSAGEVVTCMLKCDLATALSVVVQAAWMDPRERGLFAAWNDDSTSEVAQGVARLVMGRSESGFVEIRYGGPRGCVLARKAVKAPAEAIEISVPERPSGKVSVEGGLAGDAIRGVRLWEGGVERFLGPRFVEKQMGGWTLGPMPSGEYIIEVDRETTGVSRDSVVVESNNVSKVLTRRK